MEVVGIVLAVIATLFVLVHAHFRGLSTWMAILWALATFFLLVIVLPIYLLIHVPERKQQQSET